VQYLQIPTNQKGILVILTKPVALDPFKAGLLAGLVFKDPNVTLPGSTHTSPLREFNLEDILNMRSIRYLRCFDTIVPNISSRQFQKIINSAQSFYELQSFLLLSLTMLIDILLDRAEIILLAVTEDEAEDIKVRN
jgi:hypothetical protein